MTLTTKFADYSSIPFDDDDHFHEECGVFGIFDCQDASAHCALGLHALQHRGQEAAGIVSCDKEHFHQHTAIGKVGDNFNSQDVIKNLAGNSAIGHNRYSTSGKNHHTNIQPLFAETSFGGIALAHNGNLTNARKLRAELVRQGSIFRTTMDTEVVIHLLATSKKGNVIDCLISTLKELEGAYSMVALTKDCLIGARDPLGVRPLVLGQLGDAYVLASETCAFDIIGAQYVRDIEAGEIVVIKKDQLESIKPFKKVKKRFCVFEYVYFSRPDSFIEGKHVYDIRKELGAQLAKESPVKADVVVPVPDSGVPAALGYAEESGIPFDLGIIRNHYIGRTFIEPTDHVRHLGVKLKHNANIAALKGKKVILIDDSIVRGTTSKKIVTMVREAGAKEIHMRVSSPPTADSCFYGIDTPAQDELLASKMDVEEMAKFIGADTLAFLSIDGMYRATGEVERNADSPQYCDACFTSDYPTSLTDKESNVLPLFDSLVVQPPRK